MGECELVWSGRGGKADMSGFVGWRWEVWWVWVGEWPEE